jgi:very-short-patch-repair endonuclease
LRAAAFIASPQETGDGLRFLELAIKVDDMSQRLIRIARRLRVRSTSAEDIVWQQLRGRRLDGLKFRRQVPIAGYIADFCCYDLCLTVEIDGKHHDQQPEYDAVRRRAIASHGFFELRFTNDEVKERLDWVITEIRRGADIARARAPRPPFPRIN